VTGVGLVAVGVHVHFRDHGPHAVALALEDVKGMVVSLVDDTAVEQFLSLMRRWVDTRTTSLVRTRMLLCGGALSVPALKLASANRPRR
jgi:hypothetical protein